MNERDWYALKEDRTSEGPLTEAEIAQRIEDGRLSADSMVWRTGWTAWRRLSDIDSDQTAQTPSPAAPDASGVPESGCCSGHPAVSATWFCEKCQIRFCDGCVKILPMATVRTATCRKCGGGCTAVEAVTEEARPVPTRASLGLFLGAFAYPFKGNGKIMLLIGSIFIALLRIETPSFVGMYIGGAKVVLGGFAGAYILAFLFKIIRASAVGESEVPDWPKAFGEGADLTWPIPIMFKVTLIGWGIPIALVVAGFFLTKWLMLAAIPFVPLGALYIPMATLAGAMGGQEYVHPLKIVIDAFRVFRSYILALFALFVIGLVLAVAEAVSKSLAVPVLSDWVGILISFYLSMVEARILGLIYCTNREKLDWQVVL